MKKFFLVTLFFTSLAFSLPEKTCVELIKLMDLCAQIGLSTQGTKCFDASKIVDEKLRELGISSKTSSATANLCNVACTYPASYLLERKRVFIDCVLNY